jgi:peptidoglycan/LPS O-acetylase OafA/YrhL
MTRTVRIVAARGGILLPGLVIALPRLVALMVYDGTRASSPRPPWDPYNLWAQLGVFLIFFLLGYLFYASSHLLGAVRRDGVMALTLGVGIFALLLTPIGSLAPITQFSPARVLIIYLRAEGEWLVVVGILAVGLRFFTFSNAVLNYLSEAAYPLYVLHLPVLILVGLGLIRSGLPTIVALPLIVVTTLTVTLGLYDLAIRRVGALRALFGLKLSQSASGAGGSLSVTDMSHHPNGQDDRGVAQPVGKRRIDEAPRGMAHPGEDDATHED